MSDQEVTPQTGAHPKETEKELFKWSAPSRPFVPKSRDFWVKIITIASIFGFIIFIVEGAMPVILMISIIFLFYILSTVRPENLDYKISNLGIRLGDTINAWEDIKRFWFSKKGNDEILVLELLSFSGKLELVINSKDIDKIRTLLKNYLPEEEASPGRFDKAGQWLNSKLT